MAGRPGWTRRESEWREPHVRSVVAPSVNEERAMKTVSRSYDSYAQARAAVEAVEKAGIVE